MILTDIPEGRKIERLEHKIFSPPCVTRQYRGREFFVMENAMTEGPFGGMKPTFSSVANHIGCKIYQSMQFPVAETLLCGKTLSDKEYDVVCLRENLEKPNQNFFTFGDMLIPHRDMITATLTADIDILNSLFNEMYDFCDSAAVYGIRRFFAEMLVADAYLGTADRNIESWGFIYSLNNLSLAPVFDCTSALFPELDYVQMAKILTDYETGNSAFTDFIMDGVKSSFYRDGRQLTYRELLGEKERFRVEALQNIVLRIDEKNTEKIIEGEILLNPLHKKFLKIVLRERKKRILEPALQNA